MGSGIFAMDPFFNYFEQILGGIVMYFGRVFLNKTWLQKLVDFLIDFLVEF